MYDIRCVHIPGVVVDLKQNLVVDKEPIPTALGVRVERLPKIMKHSESYKVAHICHGLGWDLSYSMWLLKHSESYIGGAHICHGLGWD